MLKKIFPHLKISILDVMAYLVVISFIIFFSYFSFARHEALKSYLNDLGTYDQLVWNSAHGRLFDNSSNMLGVRNYLGAHFSLIFLAFVPFYLIAASAKWLLFFQALSAGLSLLPIYWLAKEKLKLKWAALVFLLSAAMHPALQNAVLYDFHEVVLATGFASFAFYLLEKEKYKYFVFLAILLALCQEHLSLVVFMMGLYAFFIKRQRKLGIGVSLAALAYFAFVTMVAIPHFSSLGSYTLLSEQSLFPSRYAYLGSSLKEIVLNILKHPLSIILILFSGNRPSYMFWMILPVFSLAIYAWPIVIILPILAINLLSSIPMTYSVHFYYSAIIVPFIYFASLETFKRWFFSNKVFTYGTLGLILVTSVWSSYQMGVQPFSKSFSLADYQPTSHTQLIEQIKPLIPLEAVLSVQHNLGPHFTQRREVYRFPLKSDNADYILLDRFDPFRNSHNQVFDFCYALQMDMINWKNSFSELEQNNNFEIIYNKDGYVLFKRKK